MDGAIVHFEIPAADVEKLNRFYTECFGWKFKKAEMPGFEYWLISAGPKGSIGGGIYRKQDPTERPRNYVHVLSVDDAVQRFQQAGGTIVTAKQEVPKVGYVAIGLDPEGNTVGLFQPFRPERRRATRARSRPRRRRR